MNRQARAGALMLVLLCLANALNLADRVLLGVIQEPIKAEFGLSDFQLGLLGGPAFAVLYSLLGLPIAWLAERSNRSAIVAGALALFSLMTAACGVAQNYLQLLLARIGVSVGEAGVSPPALSLISDHYPASRRGMVMSLYAVGGPMGALLATVGAGMLAQTQGWRMCFLVFGLLGLFVALLIFILVPDRGRARAAGSPLRFGEALRHLSRRRSIWHICAGAAFTGACAMFIVQYLTSFFIRVHGLSLTQASLVMGAMSIVAILGSFLGGFLADAASRRRPGSSPLVCAVAFLIAAPCYALSFWSPGLAGSILFLLCAAACLNCYTGISYAALSSVAPSTMRATTIALLTLASNLIGYAFGPPVFGKLSDIIGAAEMARGGLAPAYCAAHVAAAPCVAAAGAGLRWALSCSCILLLAAAFHYWRASRAVPLELVDETPLQEVDAPAPADPRLSAAHH